MSGVWVGASGLGAARHDESGCVEEARQESKQDFLKMCL